MIPLAAHDNAEHSIIEGIISGVFYQSAENHYTVFELKQDDKITPIKCSSKGVQLWPGMKIKLIGRHQTDKYGPVFAARVIKSGHPKTLAGLQRYLASGAFRNLGDMTAQRLVATFGLQLPFVIENTPEELKKIRGIKKSLTKTLPEDWAAHEQNRESELKLRDIGLTTKQIEKVTKAYGDAAADTIYANPYILIESVRNIGFQTADAVARKLGLATNSPARIDAALLESIRSATEKDGHCVMAVNNLIRNGSLLTGLPPADIQRHTETQPMNTLIRTTYNGKVAFSSAEMFTIERTVNHKLREILTTRPNWHIHDTATELQLAAATTGTTLNPNQEKAFHAALASRITVITGGPGTGKTTMIRSLISAFKRRNLKIMLAASYGIAASNLQNATGEPAETITMTLKPGLDGYQFNQYRHLDCDVMIIDEMNVTDIETFSDLIVALHPKTTLILVGDVNQLQPIGPGQPFHDIIESGLVNVARLTYNQRQAQASQIPSFCDHIIAGKMPPLSNDPKKTDCIFIKSKDPDKIKQQIVDLVTVRIPDLLGINPMTDIQVITPMNVKSLGVNDLQPVLQEALLKNPTNKTIKRRYDVLNLGDKVLHTKNNRTINVKNGEIGYIRDIDEIADTLTVQYPDRMVIYERDDFIQLTLAYAITVHKSEGLEYPAVVIPIIQDHIFMLHRFLLNTAVSRGKRLVVMIGHEDALETAITTYRNMSRQTKLKEYLRSP